MKMGRYTEEQIAFPLRQAEAQTPIVEGCRKMWFSQQMHSCGNRGSRGVVMAGVLRWEQFEVENHKLKTLVAHLSLD